MKILRMLIFCNGMLNIIALQAKTPFLAIRNETHRTITVKYMLYLPRWQKMSVTVQPSDETVLGDASQLRILSVYAKRKARNMWRKPPLINRVALKRALHDARNFAAHKQSSTIVFYQPVQGKEIFSFAESEHKRRRPTTMIGLPVEKMNK